MALPNQPGGPQPMTDAEVTQLEAAIDQIVAQAKAFGLDFFEMRYEICPADIIYTFGAYAMPTRFSHWSFGKAFHQMKAGRHGIGPKCVDDIGRADLIAHLEEVEPERLRLGDDLVNGSL
jgi:hypothetical protein